MASRFPPFADVTEEEGLCADLSLTVNETMGASRFALTVSVVELFFASLSKNGSRKALVANRYT